MRIVPYGATFTGVVVAGVVVVGVVVTSAVISGGGAGVIVGGVVVTGNVVSGGTVGGGDVVGGGVTTVCVGVGPGAVTIGVSGGGILGSPAFKGIAVKINVSRMPAVSMFLAWRQFTFLFFNQAETPPIKPRATGKNHHHFDILSLAGLLRKYPVMPRRMKHTPGRATTMPVSEIGRASCRERV